MSSTAWVVWALTLAGGVVMGLGLGALLWHRDGETREALEDAQKILRLHGWDEPERTITPEEAEEMFRKNGWYQPGSIVTPADRVLGDEP